MARRTWRVGFVDLLHQITQACYRDVFVRTGCAVLLWCAVLCCAYDVLLLIYGVEHDAKQTTAHFTVFDSVAWPELVLLAGLITSVAVARWF